MDIFRIPVTAEIMNRLLALQTRPEEPFNSVLERFLPLCRAQLPKRQSSVLATDAHAQPGRMTYRLFGTRHTARNAADAMCHILCMLGQGKPEFFEQLAPRIAGRCRNHVARTREAVYPGRPELAKHTREVASGWFLGTNIANREKVAILRTACEVSGILFGTDLAIDLDRG